MNVKSYIVSHWRGELGKIKSFFLNFLGAYFISVSILVGLSKVIPLPVWLGMALFTLVMVWGTVGTLRSFTKGLSSFAQRFVFIAFLILIGSALAVTILDVLRQF